MPGSQAEPTFPIEQTQPQSDDPAFLKEIVIPKSIEIVHIDGIKKMRRKVHRVIVVGGIEFALTLPWKATPFVRWVVTDPVTGAGLAYGVTEQEAIENAQSAPNRVKGDFRKAIARARAKVRRFRRAAQKKKPR